MRTFGPARVVAVAGSALAIALFVSSMPAAAVGDCATAFVREAFVLPDGSEHEPGTLTLCVDRRHSPVTFMHRTYVDGMGVGLSVGGHRLSEGSAGDEPYMMFGRQASGRLTLLGYALPGRDHMEVYTLDEVFSQTADASRADRQTTVAFDFAGG